jgi:thiol-disulfide isomerase/thioredoxin
MEAVQIARRLGASGSYDQYLDLLQDDYSWERNVVTFLMSRGRTLNYNGRPFLAEMELLDGGTMIVPRETMGRTVLIYFWSVHDPHAMEVLPQLEAARKRFAHLGLMVIGVNNDYQEDEPAVREAIATNGLGEWTHVFTGEGSENHLMSHYGIRKVPTAWIVDSAGITRRTHHHDHAGFRWHDLRSETIAELERELRKRLRHFDVRSGLFLADNVLEDAALQSSKTDAIPADSLDALLRGVFRQRISPHLSQRIERIRSLRELARALQEQHPAAPNAWAPRALELMATQYLAITEGDPVMAAHAVDMAAEWAEGAPHPALAQFSQYILLRDDLLSQPPDPNETEERLRDYTARFAESELQWPLAWFRYILAAECTDGDVVGHLSRWLGDNNLEYPRSRGLSRILLSKTVMAGWPFEAELETFDGQPLKLPHDAEGKVVVVHFWSTEYPPGSPWFMPMKTRRDISYMQLDPRLSDKLVIVGVNLDADREKARRYAESFFPGWRHTYVSDNPRHPVVRHYDVQALPSSWVVRSDGVVINNDQSRHITGLGYPYSNAYYDFRRVRQHHETEHPERWQKAWWRIKRSLLDVELHFALALPENSSHWDGRREYMIEVGRDILQKGPDLNRQYMQEQKKGFLKHLARLKQNEKGEWGPHRELKKAQGYLQRFRESARRMHELVPVAESFELLIDVEIDKQALRKAPETMPELEIPEGFPASDK